MCREIIRATSFPFGLKARKGEMFIPCTSPEFIRLGNGFNRRLDYKTKSEVREALKPLINKRGLEIGAEGYEIGFANMIETWLSDPGYMSRIEYYPIQYYISSIKNKISKC